MSSEASHYQVIFWDFDGVILNSNAVREEGFRLSLSEYPEAQVEQLLDFHRRNGGRSRYVKFRYFFEEIRGEALSNSQLNDLCARFSEHMKKLLTNPALLIPETKEFIKKQYQNYRFHIVSGSDQSELRYLCTQLGLSSYFLSIHGSPTPKNDLVAALLAEHQYPLDRCILIGDSINDYEAAQVNQIDFKAFNNSELLPYDSARAGQLGLTEAKRPFQA